MGALARPVGSDPSLQRDPVMSRFHLRAPASTLRHRFAAAVAAVLLTACATAPPSGTADPSITSPTAQVGRSEGGVVSAASVLATEVGARVLAEGGNAVDAAVATAFALAVSEPSMSGLGGRASMVIRTPEGEVFGIDGLNQVPRSYTEDTGIPSGYERAAIPGVPAALVRAQEEHGSWPLARVMEGAIRLAEAGFPLPADEAGRWASAAEDLARYPSSRATFLRPDGTPYAAGDHFRNPALARTLRAIADGGVEAFYRGWIADSIHVDMERQGGFVTRTELAGYVALDAILVEGTYRGHRLVSNFRPSSGHSVIQALQTMEAVGPAVPLEEEARWAAIVGQSMHWALEDRGRSFGSERVSARRLTSAAHARERAEDIEVPARATGAAMDIATGYRGSPAAHPVADHEPGWRVAASVPGLSEHPEAWQVPVGTLVVAPSDRGATTSLAATDANGMTVAHTQSNGPSLGTRLVASGLGFVYATRLGSEPGSRPSSTIAPTLVFNPDGSLRFGLGGAGDNRIITAVIQVISRVVDHGMSLEDAVAAARVHPGGGGALELQIEEGPVGVWSESDRARLRAWGFEMETAPSSFYGRVHAVAPGHRGPALGVAEPRWTGGAAGPRSRGPR